jgi:hypothetical protein
MDSTLLLSGLESIRGSGDIRTQRSAKRVVTSEGIELCNKVPTLRWRMGPRSWYPAARWQHCGYTSTKWTTGSKRILRKEHEEVSAAVGPGLDILAAARGGYLQISLGISLGDTGIPPLNAQHCVRTSVKSKMGSKRILRMIYNKEGSAAV